MLKYLTSNGVNVETITCVYIVTDGSIEAVGQYDPRDAVLTWSETRPVRFLGKPDMCDATVPKGIAKLKKYQKYKEIG